MIQLFVENPILLLFVMAGLGYGLGSIRIKGSSLGVAAVLFVGLFIGSLDPQLRLPDFVTFLGLAIFVYNVGLSSGPNFFSTFRQRGFGDLIFIFLMLTFSAALTAGLHFLFELDGATSAGLFAGSGTNTPALAGLLDAIANRPLDLQVKKDFSEHGVVGYSLSYPLGVLAPMAAIVLSQKLFKINYGKEEKELRRHYPVRQDIVSLAVRITRPEVVGIKIRDLRKQYDWGVVFGRYRRNGKMGLLHYDSIFEPGDEVAVVGEGDEVELVANELGDLLKYQLSFDQTDFETARIFVSEPNTAGKSLASLNLQERYEAIVTRIKRGDIDMLADSNSVLELGDRVRIVGRRKDVIAIRKLMGDSYDQLSRIDLLSFGLGMALGLMLGMVELALPGGISFKLGYAGGPLVVGLILGALRRTGPINWAIPYSANLLLQQVGLMLLLAAVGVNSGHQFMNTIQEGEGLLLFSLGGIIAFSTAMGMLLIGYFFLKIPFSFLTGMVAGQPAILDFAVGQSKNKLPTIGFTLMWPVAIITKILFAQLLFALL